MLECDLVLTVLVSQALVLPSLALGADLFLAGNLAALISTMWYIVLQASVQVTEVVKVPTLRWALALGPVCIIFLILFLDTFSRLSCDLAPAEPLPYAHVSSVSLAHRVLLQLVFSVQRCWKTG